MNPEPPQNERWETLARTANYKANELAVLCGVSLRTLQRHFSKHYQVKISEWLRAIRLRSAYTRLTSGNSVKEVAFGLGYKQLSHFSRDFKAYFGVSPSILAASHTHPSMPPAPAFISLSGEPVSKLNGDSSNL